MNRTTTIVGVFAVGSSLVACSGGLSFITDGINNAGSGSGESASTGAAAEPDKPVPMKSMAGEYRFQWGLVTITQTGDTAHGAWDGGTFDCKYDVARYKCTWNKEDNKGVGEIHWYDDELIGNWGYSMDELERPWDFRDPNEVASSAGSGAGSGSSSGSSSSEPTSVSVMIKNECSSKVEYCVVTRGGSTSNPYLSGNSSTSTSLDVGGSIKSRSGSSCGGVIANIDASTRTVVLCKK